MIHTPSFGIAQENESESEDSVFETWFYLTYHTEGKNEKNNMERKIPLSRSYALRTD